MMGYLNGQNTEFIIYKQSFEVSLSHKQTSFPLGSVVIIRMVQGMGALGMWALE